MGATKIPQASLRDAMQGTVVLILNVNEDGAIAIDAEVRFVLD